jgi:hypothetical protein
MRVRCRATADYRSNAIGLIELECAPEGLRVALCGVSSYREGYAPGPPARAPDVLVPWPSVYATQLGEQALLLSVDAKVLPQNRFMLRHFSERRPEPSGDDPRQRALATLALVLCLLAVGLLLARLDVLPHPDVFGTFGLASLVVSVVVVGLRHAQRAPELSSEQVLGELSRELSTHLPNHVAIEPPDPPPPRFVLQNVIGLLPRSAVGISISLAAATLAALVGSRAARPAPAAHEASAPEAPAASAGVPSAGAARELAEETLAAEPGRSVFGEACQCNRGDESLAWGGPLPRLSPLLLVRREHVHDGHHHFELEVALVNNAAEPVTRVGMSVVFFEELGGGQQGQRQSGERPLYFEGPLLPGRMIKWHVAGRGTSFDIVGPDLGSLARDGSDAARGEAWDGLVSLSSRVLQLHTMRVLAFLDDPRVQTLAAQLRQGASDAELHLLDRLSRAPPAVVACAVRVRRESGNQWRGGACIQNHSDEPAARLALRLLAYDAPLLPDRLGERLPEVLAEHTTALQGTLPARVGKSVELTASFPLEEAVVPRAFEVLVDREEYLR